MKQLSQTQSNIIQLLSDGNRHSGSELGKRLGISRTAIWKQIKQLMELGIPIQSLANQGYQLPKHFQLLNEQDIAQHLAPFGLSQSFKLHLFTSITSTNSYLKELPTNPQKGDNDSISNVPRLVRGIQYDLNKHTQLTEETTSMDPANKSRDVGSEMSSDQYPLIHICCSEEQTQGRGRFGRHWYSPFGENIYCSSRWNLNCDLNKLSGLSLVVSLSIIASLKELQPDEEIKVKWPNDILWQDKKLCGTLIEIIAESNSTAQVIIGMGLNVNSDTQHNPLPDKPWCSLYEMTKKHFNRNLIVAVLLKNLTHYLDQFLTHGLGEFLKEWGQSDYLSGKRITVNQASHTLTGVACGINDEGLLIVEDEHGIRHELSSGDTTLKSKE